MSVYNFRLASISNRFKFSCENWQITEQASRKNSKKWMITMMWATLCWRVTEEGQTHHPHNPTNPADRICFVIWIIQVINHEKPHTIHHPIFLSHNRILRITQPNWTIFLRKIFRTRFPIAVHLNFWLRNRKRDLVTRYREKKWLKLMWFMSGLYHNIHSIFRLEFNQRNAIQRIANFPPKSLPSETYHTQ